MNEITRLPDGSAFTIVSLPLPENHWLTKEGYDDPPTPILSGNPTLRDGVIAAAKYAIRGATARGSIKDFDPDALLQNLIYALFRNESTEKDEL